MIIKNHLSQNKPVQTFSNVYLIPQLRYLDLLLFHNGFQSLKHPYMLLMTLFRCIQKLRTLSIRWNLVGHLTLLIPIIAFKRSPYLRSYLTKLIEVIWRTNTTPPQWKGAFTILFHKKDSTVDLSNFKLITSQSIPLNVFTSALRNKVFVFLMKNNYIETSVQRGFMPGMSRSFEHAAHLAHLILQAKRNQISLVVTLC